MIALPDWKNPTPAMLAGVRMAKLCAEKGGLNETMFAEWLLASPESLWYLQAAQWAENPPEILKEEKTRTIFKQGCEIIVKIVDLGYDSTEDQWWPLVKMWPEKVDQYAGILTLMETAMLLERMKDTPIWPKDTAAPTVGYATHVAPGFLTVSAGFWVFFSLVLGPRWRQRYAAMIEGAQLARRMKFIPGRRRRR